MTPFAQDIWVVDGPCVATLGFEYQTRAAVIRLPSGDLFVWSPVKLTDGLAQEISTLGRVRYLVAPNALHHLYIGEWADAFPKAQVFGLRALRGKRPDLMFSGFLDDAGPFPWGDAIAHRIVPNKITAEAVFFHQASRTVIFTDLIQQFPPGWHTGWRAIIARLDLMVGDRPNVPRKFRLGFPPRAKARAAVKPIMDWPAERILMAHGAPVTTDGQRMLRQAFDWLF